MKGIVSTNYSAQYRTGWEGVIVANGNSYRVPGDVAARDIRIRNLIREALEMLDKNAPGRAKGLLQEAYTL